MRRDADDDPFLLRHSKAGRFHQTGKLIKAVDEAQLFRSGRLPAEPGMSVKYWQQCEANARRLRGRSDALGEFTDVVVVSAARIAMDVVKFSDTREAPLQHLDIGLRCNGLNIFWGHSANEAIHQFTPRPEAIGRRPFGLGQARHAALKSVTVEIRKSG